MKRMLTLVLALAACSILGTPAFAQPGTEGDGFLVQVKIGAKTYLWANEACGYGVAQWGAEVIAPDEPEGELVYARTADQDSFLCAPAANNLTGKFALCSRGPIPGTACSFSLKAYHAQLAGAKAAVIMNHYANATENSCTIFLMSPGDSAAAVTIPAIFLSREASEIVRAALDAGIKVDMKFVFPRMYDATAAYHFATPVDHVDTLDHITVRYVNRTSSPQTNVTLKCDIIEPAGGTNKSLSVPLGNVAVGKDTLVTFPPYLPSKVKGTFKAVFTNDKFSEQRDTLVREFVHTDYTWSAASFTNDAGGIGPTDADFINGEYRYQCGSLCLTGDNASNRKATHVSFGISNAADVYVPGGFAGENDLLVFVYDGDPNDDGTIDFSNSWEAMDDNGQQVAFGTYTMKGDEQDGQILSAPLSDLFENEFVELKPNHPYYVSVLYNGLLAGSGKSVRFMNSFDEHYLNFPTTPVYLNNTMYSGWNGAVVMTRLQLQGFDPTVSTNNTLLADSKISVQPNPAADVVRVDLNLETVNQGVTVRMMDMTGRMYDYQTMKNFQSGQVSFDTQALPSGMYMIWVSTAEGSTVKRVAVCH